MDVICVTNRKLSGRVFLEQLKLTAAAKPKYIILREKDMTEEDYLHLAEKALEICQNSGTKLICNSFLNIAERIGAEGIHLPLSLAEKYTGKIKPMGISVHSVDDALKAAKLGADYLIYGHIFTTDCKKGLAPRGVKSLEKVCSSVGIPVYAIGGITPENAVLTKTAGATGVCLMSSLMAAENPKEIIEKIKQI